MSVKGDAQAPLPTLLPFGSSLSALFGLLVFTTFIESSHLLTLPTTLAPYRLNAGSVTLSSRLGCPVRRLRDTLSGGFGRFVTLPPCSVGYC